jgi:hypothetical protein
MEMEDMETDLAESPVFCSIGVPGVTYAKAVLPILNNRT